jgi:NADP-dependent 3-hydroxy acid dehydrogenase YdfG
MGRFDGQGVVVTGGGTGIGRSTALAFAAQGAVVAVVGRRAGPLDEVVADIEGTGGRAVAVTADLVDPDAPALVASKALAELGRVDCCVHNAGFSSSIRSARYLGLDEWNAVLAVNVTGPAMLTRELLPHLIDRGSGTIVLVSSLAAIRPNVMAGAAYGAAKAAATNYMEELASEVRNAGVRCTTVLPGEVDTAILDRRALPPGEQERSTMVHPDDVAAMITAVVGLPARAMVDQLVISPTVQRDYGADVAAALAKGAPA